MNAVILLLALSPADARAVQAKPVPGQALPVPTGRVGSDCRLYTDWTPLTQRRPVWRIARWIDETVGWEESAAGQPGGRLRATVSQTEYDRVTTTAARLAAGDGGIGPGFEWEVFVGDSWTAGVDVEFTVTGPRMVVALVHYPVEGVTYRYGWSVLSGQLVTANGWHFDKDVVGELYFWGRLFVIARWDSFLNQFGAGQRE